MKDSSTQKFRNLNSGIGLAVAKRTVLRRKKDGSLEDWGDVADRVAFGNASLLNNIEGFTDQDISLETSNLRDHIAQARILMSGRHLQHGDETQPSRNMEVFTNCSSAASSHILYYLLLNGSGVGRSYSDDLMVVDWGKAPSATCVLSKNHPDFKESALYHDHKDQYVTMVQSLMKTEWVVVEDSREGWAKALERWENLAFDNPDKIEHLIFDFTPVREAGAPIKGMQNRPASGPVPTIECFKEISDIAHNKEYSKWEKTIRIDHLCAANVVVGGARRSARMASKHWKDPEILKFIHIKKEAGLWTANNSVEVDQEFWDGVKNDNPVASRIFYEISMASFFDKTGEPGYINVDKLRYDKGEVPDGMELGSYKYPVSKETKDIYKKILSNCKNKQYNYIVNPCGEIAFAAWGAFCVIADVVPYFADTLEEAKDAFRAATRSLIRVNTMPSIYDQEVKRTNRIGVGMTGLFEFAWKFFGYGFKDLIDEKKSKDFWKVIDEFREEVENEAELYAQELGVEIPHTALTLKPAGCQSLDSIVSTTEGFLHLDELGDEFGSKRQEISIETYGENCTTDHSNEFFVNGFVGVKDVHLSSGLTLTCTPNHKYKVLRDGKVDWVMACQMQEGDVMPYQVGYYEGGSEQKLNYVQFKERPNKKKWTQPEILDEDLAWFLGVYFGDGSNHKKGIRISGNTNERKGFDRLSKIIKDKFSIDAKVYEDGRDGHNGCALYVNNVDFTDWLAANGIKKQKAHDIEIPAVIRKSKASVINAFLNGFIVADGCDKTHCNSFVTVSEKFAKQAVVMLRAIGRDCKFRKMPPTDSSYGNKMRFWVAERKGRRSNERYIKKTTKEKWRDLDSAGFENANFDVVEFIDERVVNTADIQVPNSKTFVSNSYISHNTTSKLFNLTEAAHLPSMAFYLRWVQHKSDDPRIKQWQDKGYPIRELTSYPDTTIVGFPTAPSVATLGLGDKLVTAGEATPEEQYKWLQLLEKHWLGDKMDNQISYTLKYDPDSVSFLDFCRVVLENQPKIKCCSVMPQIEATAYEYQPEEPISKEDYDKLVARVSSGEYLEQEVAREHVDCENGACPVDFNENV